MTIWLLLSGLHVYVRGQQKRLIIRGNSNQLKYLDASWGGFIQRQEILDLLV